MAGSSKISTTPEKTNEMIPLPERIKGLEKSFKKSPDKFIIQLAEAYLEDGRPHDAQKYLGKIGLGNDEGRMVLLAQAHFDQFNNDDAAKLLKQATAKDDLNDNVRAQLLLGEIAFEQGESSTAKSHLKRCVKQLKDNDSRYRRVAILLNNLGEDIKVPEEVVQDDLIEGFRTEDHTKEKAGSAFMQIILVAVVCAGLTALYVQNARQGAAAAELVMEAKPMLEVADVRSLRSAIKQFDEALTIDPANSAAIASKAEAHALLWGHHHVAENETDARHAADYAADEDIQRAERYSAVAWVALAGGDSASAERLLNDMIEQGAMSEKFNWILGQIEWARGDVDTGLKNLRVAHEMSSQAPHYATSLGDAWDEQGDRYKAATYWNKAAASNPSYLPGAARALLTKIRSGKPSKDLLTELTRFDKVPLEQASKLGKTYLETTRAELAYRRGDTSNALIAVDKAIALGGENARRMELKGRILLAEGGDKAKSGLALLLNTHTQRPKSARYYYALLTGYGRLQNWKEGAALIEKGKKSYQEEKDFHVAAGNFYTLQGDFLKAAAAYEEALKLHKDYSTALLGKGIVLWKTKKVTEAIDVFNTAVGVRSQFPEVYESIGLMLIEAKDLTNGNNQLIQAEQMYRKMGRGAVPMHDFYVKVFTTLKNNRGTALMKDWVAREKAFRTDA